MFTISSKSVLGGELTLYVLLLPVRSIYRFDGNVAGNIIFKTIGTILCYVGLDAEELRDGATRSAKLRLH